MGRPRKLNIVRVHKKRPKDGHALCGDEEAVKFDLTWDNVDCPKCNGNAIRELYFFLQEVKEA